MKKLLTACFVSILFIQFFLILPAYASVPTTNPNYTNKQEKQSLLQQNRVELQQRLEEKKASKEAQLTEKNRVRLRFYWGRLKIRLEAYIGRLEILIQRIENRIAYIKENNENINTDKIEATLQDAKDKLAEASSLLDTEDTNFENLLTLNSPKDVLKQIKDDIKEIKSILVEVHGLLVKVIGDIKGLRVGQSGKISPTLSPTP
ncbi:hypothetical protein A2159_02000 [Candidatus Woesebacteria bacterium RBG_13_34_9]|uniref:DUF5667 domain-containing protein n=1 Tax=Candidatus Woesebacteria bacterium RBG_13_34_9 TaxID=1802477 RepID=A0A1F7WZR4_9BACT|nr:MAG: hypothetical protein A2159_02000 [Candidatus Woesebacteria bacterium RBG_13_34_9]